MNKQELGISQESKDGAVIFRFSGALVLKGVREASKKVSEVLEDDTVKKLVVDMSAAPFIDSSGIGFLVNIHNRLEERGGKMGVFGLNKVIKEIMGFAKLDRRLAFFSTEDEALSGI